MYNLGIWAAEHYVIEEVKEITPTAGFHLVILSIGARG